MLAPAQQFSVAVARPELMAMAVKVVAILEFF
jgi:hypothetical protein